MKKASAHTTPTYDMLLQKAEHFCAYRERCTWEVVEKLKSLEATSGQVSGILNSLSENGFLDDHRFCMGFVRGKINNNQWGRNRIYAELSHRQMPEAFIQEALQQVDPAEYENILYKQALKKHSSLKDIDTFTRNGKIAAFCINKGFEPALVWKMLKEKF